MATAQEKIQSVGVVPVITIDSPEQALPLGKALLAGGLPIAEVTFRTAAGEAAIRIMRKELDDLLVGAGTIIDVDGAKRAKAAGAQFIVSPGYDDAVVAYCQEEGMPIFPGVNSPSQIQEALRRGLSILKFFPAEASGGIPMLKALSAPFPTVKFMPTGGIGLGNLGNYLQESCVIACGGSWMVPKALISQGKWDEITRLCKEAVHAVHGFTFAHLGINENSNEEAAATAKALSHLLPPMSEKTNSYFAADDIEVMKEPNHGTHGHIGIKTRNVERALQYLKLFGFERIPGSERYADNGSLKFIYLSPEVGGFAIHIMQG
ncbi:bifunctional 4-hydroxy-2-oxoglutarate aldolase/2-dehydro-3-deoxy-phosphogluconate aldolase [Pleomorphochaeta sp. DL1XJH-081]|uniref:bifunctional 4-hydroxy-2-oxoglutarate aldolase/2-dehydro-3-deoxy-phosphogluconate aldolase n=1 Tax=Pleomorphochaeta sp. DL1XJH-081 TaxID=3409690 RepID=UPI003BB6E4B5